MYNKKDLFSSFLLTNVLVDGVIYSAYLTNTMNKANSLKTGALCLVTTSIMSLISYINTDEFNKKLKKD